MRFLVAALIVVVAQTSMACFGEGQIVAQVKVMNQSPDSCLTVVQPTIFEHYSSNATCPLDIDELHQGFIINRCDIQDNETVSGVLIKQKLSGAIILEEAF